MRSIIEKQDMELRNAHTELDDARSRLITEEEKTYRGQEELNEIRVRHKQEMAELKLKIEDAA